METSARTGANGEEREMLSRLDDAFFKKALLVVALAIGFIAFRNYVLIPESAVGLTEVQSIQTDEKAMVSVPDFSGLTIDRTRELAAANGLKIEVSVVFPNDDGSFSKRPRVSSQDYSPGMTLKTGHTVHVGVQ